MPDEREDLSDEMMVVAYNELRRLARFLRRGRNVQTLNTTALVNEAFARLGQSKTFRAESPDHLKHTLFRAMRFILIDAIRKKSTAQRGGGEVSVSHVPLEEDMAPGRTPAPELSLALDSALERLGTRDPQQARAIELRFFFGLTDGEIGDAIGIPEAEVRKLLRRAKASLRRILQPASSPPPRGGHA